MKKQAILISAYTDADAIKEIIRFFNKDYESHFNFYIHLDRKCGIHKNEFNDFKNVTVWKKNKVFWGGFSHLNSILFLCKKALKNKENGFFHLITCQDFPAQKASDFLTINFENNYLDFVQVPRQDGAWQSENGGLDRIDYYHLYDFFNCKEVKFMNYNKKLIKLQKKFNFKRRKIKLPLWGGATYWSLNRTVLAYVISYTQKNRSFLRRFKNTFCPEELYFQTVILNSDQPHFNLCNNYRRYIDWSSGKGGYPAFLDIHDLDKILESNSFFCRKVKADERELKINLNKIFNDEAH